MTHSHEPHADQPDLLGLTDKREIEVIHNDTRRSTSRYSARLDSILFDPPYLLEPGVSYAMRIMHGEGQIWQVECSRKGVAWIAEAKRASGPPFA